MAEPGFQVSGCSQLRRLRYHSVGAGCNKVRSRPRRVTRHDPYLPTEVERVAEDFSTPGLRCGLHPFGRNTCTNLSGSQPFEAGRTEFLRPQDRDSSHRACCFWGELEEVGFGVDLDAD